LSVGITVLLGILMVWRRERSLNECLDHSVYCIIIQVQTSSQIIFAVKKKLDNFVTFWQLKNDVCYWFTISDYPFES